MERLLWMEKNDDTLRRRRIARKIKIKIGWNVDVNHMMRFIPRCDEGFFFYVWVRGRVPILSFFLCQLLVEKKKKTLSESYSNQPYGPSRMDLST